MDLLNTPVKVVESKSQEVENSIFFKINSKFIEDSSCFYIITINDSIEVVSTKTLIQLQTIEEITKIKLFYACPDYPVVPYFIRDTVGTVVYYVKNPTSNVYEFEWNVDDELFNYEVFDNDTLDIKNESLYFRSKEIKLIKKK